MFLIDAIKPKVKELKSLLFLARLFRGVKLVAYKINKVIFLSTVGLLAATKLYSKETRKYNTTLYPNFYTMSQNIYTKL